MGGVSVRWSKQLLAMLLLVSVGACRRNPAGDGPYASEVADAVPRLEKATGLKFRTAPTVEVRTRDQVRDFLLRKFDEASPAQELAGEESAYKLLGMLPDSMDLRRFLLAVLTEQVAGYYDPATKVLYVVKGADELRGFAAFVPTMAPGARHWTSNVSIDGDGNSATAKLYLQMYSTAGGAAETKLVISGVYEDTLRRDDSAWRFVTRKLTVDT